VRHRRRAGSAGGNEPKIDELKRYWLRSIEVINRDEAVQQLAVEEEEEEEEEDDLDPREHERHQAATRRANEGQFLSALRLRREERAGKMEMERMWNAPKIEEVETTDHDEVAYNSYY
jgi:hypothetical protein